MLKTQIYNPPNTKDRINILYAVISIDKNGKEGIGAISAPSTFAGKEVMMSAVTSDPLVAEAALEGIVKAAKAGGIKDTTFEIRTFGELRDREDK